MTALSIAAPPETHRPELRGRWVFAYRLTWATLALVAVGVMAASVHEASAHPAVLALRLAKAAIIIAVCVILLRRRANDTVAALLSLTLLTWTITSSFDFASAELLPRLLDRVRFLLFVLALLLFPDARWRPRWTRGVAFASGAVFLLGIAEGLGAVPIRLFLPLAIGCVVAAIAALIVRFRTAATQTERQQLKWVALGLFSGVGLILTARTGAALTAGHAMPIAAPVLLEGLFQLGIILVALGFLVSLLRYRLFDAEAAITRSAALAGLTIAVVATFAGTEAAIELVGQQYLGMGIGDVSAAMAAAVAAVLLNPLHNRISDWAENRFQRDLIGLKKELPEMLAELAASATPRELGQAILPRIRAAVHATRSALIVRGRVVAADGIATGRAQASLGETGAVVSRDEVDGGDPVFPVRFQLHGPLSNGDLWLALGPRPDGSLYGRDDLEALAAIVPAIRHALAWALDRERFRMAHRRDVRALRAQISAIGNSRLKVS